MKCCTAAILIPALFLAACDETRDPAGPEFSDRADEAGQVAGSPAPPSAPEPIDLVARGRTVYQTNCIACHNPDPTQTGSLGPEITGSSRELLEARILHGEYPEGYEPKRETQQMIPLPHLEADLDALAAFLDQ